MKRPCDVCGSEALKLIGLRMTATDKGSTLKITEAPTSGDALVCEDCIRDIKRLPITQITNYVECPF